MLSGILHTVIIIITIIIIYLFLPILKSCYDFLRQTGNMSQNKCECACACFTYGHFSGETTCAAYLWSGVKHVTCTCNPLALKE